MAKSLLLGAGMLFWWDKTFFVHECVAFLSSHPRNYGESHYSQNWVLNVDRASFDGSIMNSHFFKKKYKFIYERIRFARHIRSEGTWIGQKKSF